MSLQKRHSLSPQQNSTRDLKQRVITCLNKLSDRDTYAIAKNELEQIARDLSDDSFPIYLNCLYYTDPSHKSPVRKQCARLLGFVSDLHGDALSPFVSKMLANIVKRLRDSDTAVRSACVDSVAAMARQITKPPFSVFLRTLMEAIFQEQDQNSQIGLSLCLASAIEASSDPDIAQLQRFLPKLVKLVKSQVFKAKPALLSLIGSIVGAGGASSQNVLAYLVPCLVEFLSSEDWAARKASAEVFERLAVVVERDLLEEFKSSLLPTFESKRFDRVKVVRETMNRMLEAWKDVPNVSDQIAQPAQSKSYSKENASDGRYPPGSKSSSTRDFKSPQVRKLRSTISRESPPDRSSATTVRQRTPLKNESKSSPAMFRKLNRNKPTNWNIEISDPYAPRFKTVCEDNPQGKDDTIAELGGNKSIKHHKVEAKRSLFSRNNDDKMHKFGGLKSGSRVVPLHEEESLESTVVVSNNTKELYGNPKNSEDLSLIRKQLLQIENQQTSLLDLLQRFMGSSQNGMQSLETRVHGLEMALDEISYDLAVSTGRISNPETAGNACCKLPGAEFLSPKFWRKAEGRQSTSTPSRSVLCSMADRDGSAESFKLENRRFRNQAGGFVINPLADIRTESRQNSEFQLNGLQKNVAHNSEGRQARNLSGLDVASTQTGTNSRSAALLS